MKNNNLLITIIIAVVVGAVGFFGGMQYQKSNTSSLNGVAGGGGAFMRGQGRQFQGRFGGGTNGNATGRGAVLGKIIDSNNNTITVQLRDGSSKIAVLSDKTTYETTTQASKTDLKTGVPVAVIGTTNSDGSVTADSVQINPRLGRNMMNGGNGTPSAPTQ